MKKYRIICCLLYSLFAVFLFTSCKNTNEPLDTLDLFFLKTHSQSDCIVLQTGSHAVIIDTGELSDSRQLAEFLRERNIEVIPYLILSYPNEHYTDSALSVLNEFRVENVIMPFYSGPNENYEVIMNVLKEKRISLHRPLKRRYFNFFRLGLMVYPPRELYYSEDNNYSLAVLGNYGKTRMLFAGDGTGKRIRELMDMEWTGIDLLKIPYHGRAGRSSADFVMKQKARYGVIFAGKGDSRITETLAAAGTRAFYTREGDLHFIANGLELLPADEVNNEKKR